MYTYFGIASEAIFLELNNLVGFLVAVIFVKVYNSFHKFIAA